MSIALVCFGCILPLMTTSAIALLVCSGVGGCLCPNSLSMILMYTASHAVMFNPASSALVANDMTFLIMCAMLSTSLPGLLCFQFWIFLASKLESNSNLKCYMWD